MKLHHVRHFLAIADNGSMHRAAVHLGVAQSALSRCLAELEANLGAVLVERGRTGSTLRPAGRRFATRARSMDEEIRRAGEEARQSSGTRTGRISLGMSPTGQMLLLPHVLSRFYRDWPGVLLSIHDGIAEDCEQSLLDGRMDFFAGACPQRKLDPRLSHAPICKVDRVVLARPESRYLGRRQLADLVDAPWVAVRANDATQADHDSVFQSLGIAAPMPIGIATSMLTVWLMMRAVDALAIVPRAWWDETPSQGIFSQIKLQDGLGAIELCTVRRTALPLTPAAQHLFDLISETANTAIVL